MQPNLEILTYSAHGLEAQSHGLHCIFLKTQSHPWIWVAGQSLHNFNNAWANDMFCQVSFIALTWKLNTLSWTRSHAWSLYGPYLDSRWLSYAKIFSHIMELILWECYKSIVHCTSVVRYDNAQGRQTESAMMTQHSSHSPDGHFWWTDGLDPESLRDSELSSVLIWGWICQFLFGLLCNWLQQWALVKQVSELSPISFCSPLSTIVYMISYNVIEYDVTDWRGVWMK